jgi:hypothetical protein
MGQMEKQVNRPNARKQPVWDSGSTRPIRGADFRQKANDTVSSDRVRIPTEGLGIFYTIQLILWPAVWMIWVFLWRGGLSFYLLGLALARSDGRKAARWQCALRALLVWVPVAALWAAALWLDVWYWSSWPTGSAALWIPWLSWVLWWAGFLLLPLYVALAILFPRRSVHDWLAGTYVVPR